MGCNGPAATDTRHKSQVESSSQFQGWAWVITCTRSFGQATYWLCCFSSSRTPRSESVPSFLETVRDRLPETRTRVFTPPLLHHHLSHYYHHYHPLDLARQVPRHSPQTRLCSCAICIVPARLLFPLLCLLCRPPNPLSLLPAAPRFKPLGRQL